MTISISNLKVSIPVALKWTLVADFITIGAQTLKFLPPTIFGIPTAAFTTFAGAILLTWEQYALNEAAEAGQPSPVVPVLPVTSPTVVPPPSNPTPPPSNSTPTFALSVTPSSAAVGSTVTFNIANATPNGTVQLFQEENQQSLTGKIATSSTGSATLQYTLDSTSTIGDILAVDGSVDIYALDTTTGNHTATITLTKVS